MHCELTDLVDGAAVRIVPHGEGACPRREGAAARLLSADARRDLDLGRPRQPAVSQH